MHTHARIGRLFVLAFVLCAVALVAADPCMGEAAFQYRYLRGRAEVGTLDGGAVWYRLINPAATDTDAVHSLYATNDSSHVTYAFSAGEKAALISGSAYVGEFPISMSRAASITISAPVAADIKAGTATIYGKNLLSEQITETYTINADTEETLVGALAFAVIDSINVPEQDSLGVKISVGRSLKVGLPMSLPMPTLLMAFQAGAQTDDSVVAIDSDEIEKNTVYVSSTAWNGAVDFDFLFWIPPLGDVGGTTKW